MVRALTWDASPSLGLQLAVSAKQQAFMQEEAADSRHYAGVSPAAKGGSWVARLSLRAAPHAAAQPTVESAAGGSHLLTCKTALEAAVAHDLGCCWAELHTSQHHAASVQSDW